MNGDDKRKEEVAFVFDDERDTADERPTECADERPTEYADAAASFSAAAKAVPPAAAVPRHAPAPAAPAPATADDYDEDDMGDGETRGMETRAGSMEEILALKRDYERKVKTRKTFHLVAIFVAVAALAGVYFLTQRNRETEWMSIPVNPATGKANVREYVVKAKDGDVLLRVDYPVSRNMSVSEDDNGIEVASRMGRDADVPYYMRFEIRRSADELTTSLADSAWRWMQRLHDADGCLFTAQNAGEIKPDFFEDVYGWCCEEETLHGVRFVLVPYQRTRSDKSIWRGFAIYFRSGDAAYSLRREIPDSQWKRGEGQLRTDPNLAVFARFANDYWESPGVEGLPLDWPSEKLVREIRRELHPMRSGIWTRIRKWIDALLVEEWRGDGDAREAGMKFLKQLREYQKNFYWGEYNAFEVAKGLDNGKRMNKIRQDCKFVFSDPADRRNKLIANEKIW